MFFQETVKLIKSKLSLVKRLKQMMTDFERSRFRVMEAKVNAVQTQVTDLEKRQDENIATVQTQVTDLEKHQDEKIATVQTQVTDLEKRQDEKIATVQTQVTDLRSRCTTLITISLLLLK